MIGGCGRHRLPPRCRRRPRRRRQPRRIRARGHRAQAEQHLDRSVGRHAEACQRWRRAAVERAAAVAADAGAWACGAAAAAAAQGSWCLGAAGRRGRRGGARWRRARRVSAGRSLAPTQRGPWRQEAPPPRRAGARARARRLRDEDDVGQVVDAVKREARPRREDDARLSAAAWTSTLRKRRRSFPRSGGLSDGAADSVNREGARPVAAARASCDRRRGQQRRGETERSRAAVGLAQRKAWNRPAIALPSACTGCCLKAMACLGSALHSMTRG